MKNPILILILPIFFCCSNQKNHPIEQLKTNKIIVTADSCMKWGLEPVNFEVTFPDYYTSQLNVPGGYYLQLTKFNGDTIIHQISVGVASNLEFDKLGRYIHNADSIFKSVFESAGIKYTTDFLGKANFLGQKVDQGRASVVFNNFPNEGSIANGEYSTFMAFQVSMTNPKEAVVISIISSKKEKLNPETNVAIENEKIIKTLILK